MLRDTAIGLAPANRAVLTELACARSLLDELEDMLGARGEDGGEKGQRPWDVMSQAAEELARVATTLNKWAQAGAARNRDAPPPERIATLGPSVRAPSFNATTGDATSP